jgi:hypothetical protein
VLRTDDHHDAAQRGRARPGTSPTALAGRHAVVGGSLGKGNLGDDMLLRVFLKQVGPDYRAVTVLSQDAPEDLGAGVSVVPPAPVAVGRRFWHGATDRPRLRRRIVARAPEAERDCVWLGGLFGPHRIINLARDRELSWARSFCNRLVYFFGDVHDGFLACSIARRLVRRIDSGEAWLAVRSAEAADLLDHLGVRSRLWVGVDIVLYDLARQLGWPFRRRNEATATLAIVPCIYRSGRFFDAWLAAARGAADRGLGVRWVSFCDAEDLPLCRALADALAAQRPGHPQAVHRATASDLGLGDAAACIASRFHGAIYSLASGLPTIGFAYDPKVRNLFRMFGIEDWLASDPARLPGEALAAELAERLDAALDGRFAPVYDEFARRLAGHEAALVDLTSRRAGEPGRPHRAAR